MRKRTLWAALAVAAISTAAWAFPWDIDLYDSPAKKPYSWKMRPMPEGSVARSGDSDITKVNRMTGDPASPEGKALQNPYTVDEALLKKGEHAFTIYCQTCHGVGGDGGAPVGDNSNGKRWLLPIPKLVGPTGRAPGRTDGQVYLTIRKGKASMPAYSWAMTEQEMWATVAYLRTLPGGAYVPPTETQP